MYHPISQRWFAAFTASVETDLALHFLTTTGNNNSSTALPAIIALGGRFEVAGGVHLQDKGKNVSLGLTTGAYVRVAGGFSSSGGRSDVDGLDSVSGLSGFGSQTRAVDLNGMKFVDVGVKLPTLNILRRGMPLVQLGLDLGVFRVYNSKLGAIRRQPGDPTAADAKDLHALGERTILTDASSSWGATVVLDPAVYGYVKTYLSLTDNVASRAEKPSTPTECPEIPGLDLPKGTQASATLSLHGNAQSIHNKLTKWREAYQKAATPTEKAEVVAALQEQLNSGIEAKKTQLQQIVKAQLLAVGNSDFRKLKEDELLNAAMEWITNNWGNAEKLITGFNPQADSFKIGFSINIDRDSKEKTVKQFTTDEVGATQHPRDCLYSAGVGAFEGIIGDPPVAKAKPADPIVIRQKAAMALTRDEILPFQNDAPSPDDGHIKNGFKNAMNSLKTIIAKHSSEGIVMSAEEVDKRIDEICADNDIVRGFIGTKLEGEAPFTLEEARMTLKSVLRSTVKPAVLGANGVLDFLNLPNYSGEDRAAIVKSLQETPIVANAIASKKGKMDYNRHVAERRAEYTTGIMEAMGLYNPEVEYEFNDPKTGELKKEKSKRLRIVPVGEEQVSIIETGKDGGTFSAAWNRRVLGFRADRSRMTSNVAIILPPDRELLNRAAQAAAEDDAKPLGKSKKKK